MATEVGVPIPAPPFSPDTWEADMNAYLAELKTKANQANDGEYVGEVLRWPRADGYAQYMVWSERPLQIMHLDIIDGWRIEDALIRGLNLTTVAQMVQSERHMRELFNGPNERFYTKDRVGQIVHYNHGFGQFIRCEVVEAEEHDNHTSRDRKTIGGVALKPIALVGEWRQYDLPRRLPNGEVHYGYNAEQIIEGRLMQPNGSTIVESSDYRPRAGEPDPRTLEPIDLTPPAETPDEQRRAALVRELEKVLVLARNADVTDEGDVFATLSAIAEVASSATRSAS